MEGSDALAYTLPSAHTPLTRARDKGRDVRPLAALPTLRPKTLHTTTLRDNKKKVRRRNSAKEIFFAVENLSFSVLKISFAEHF